MIREPSKPADIAIAERFIAARRNGESLDGYPGEIPESLDAGYAIQDAAIDLWGDEIVGWKIGRIPDPLVKELNETRLVGPIFRAALMAATDAPVEFPVFVGGFAAVEGEYVLVAGKDAPEDKTRWTTEEAWDMVGDVRIAIEPAGSPLATINALGPCVTVSDFGNNAGLILGPSMPDWKTRPMDQWAVRTIIDGETIGAASADTMPGGPIESFRVLLEKTASRGRPLRKGMFASTGAVTGVHEVIAGQSSRVVFEGVGDLLCRAVPFRELKAQAAQ